VTAETTENGGFSGVFGMENPTEPNVYSLMFLAANLGLIATVSWQRSRSKEGGMRNFSDARPPKKNSNCLSFLSSKGRASANDRTRGEGMDECGNFPLLPSLLTDADRLKLKSLCATDMSFQA
jgi:hypothetical protein